MNNLHGTAGNHQDAKGRCIGAAQPGETSPVGANSIVTTPGSRGFRRRLVVLATCWLMLLIAAPAGLAPVASGSPHAPIPDREVWDRLPQAAEVVPGSYVVVYRDNAVSARGVSQRGRNLGITVDHEFTNVVQGFSASLTPAQVRELRQDDAVLFVEPNVVVRAHDRLPTGVNRIGADSGRNGVRPPAGGLPVAVFDTGVANHPDLNVVGGKNCTGAGPVNSYTDVHGHGTHVAGTIGANGSVPGVAPNTPIYAVKVLGDNGRGTIANVICGLEWVADSPDLGIVAINMSLGASCAPAQDCGPDDPGTCDSALHRAICTLTSAGVAVVVSAGNDGRDARESIPARYDQVITVGAFTDTDGCWGGRGRASLSGYRDDRKWPWSNHGPAVDVIAPGDDILSTLPGGYGVLSGTSMAAPHVTGAIARGWNPDGGARGPTVPGFGASQGVVLLSGNVGCPPKPKVKVSRQTVPAGTRVTVRLRHFAPGERVRLRLGGRSLGTVVVNSKGAVNKSVKVPAGSKAGRLRIRATGNNGNHATVKVNVNPRK